MRSYKIKFRDNWRLYKRFTITQNNFESAKGAGMISELEEFIAKQVCKALKNDNYFKEILSWLYYRDQRQVLQYFLGDYKLLMGTVKFKFYIEIYKPIKWRNSITLLWDLF